MLLYSIDGEENGGWRIRLNACPESSLLWVRGTEYANDKLSTYVQGLIRIYKLLDGKPEHPGKFNMVREDKEGYSIIYVNDSPLMPIIYNAQDALNLAVVLGVAAIHNRIAMPPGSED